MPHLVYLAFALLPGVLSQTVSMAICSVTFYLWTFNSLGDSPCDVAADLGGVCNGGDFTVLPLEAGPVYLGPTAAEQNSCCCSSVYYSMLSACAACQGRNWLDWSKFNTDCTTVYPGVFLQPIPVGTRVPGWAYVDVMTGAFNVTVAQSLENLPESTGVASPTSSFTFPTSGTSFSLSTSSRTAFPTSLTSFGLGTSSRTAFPASPTAPPASSSGSNAGAIAGGVIGGVVGLALIGGIVSFFLLRRRREASEKPASSTFNTTPYVATSYNPDPNMDHNHTASSFTPVHQNLYDPSDPNTFPGAPAPAQSSNYTNTYSPPPYASSYPSFQNWTTQVGHPPQMQMPGPVPAAHYTGAPEL